MVDEFEIFLRLLEIIDTISRLVFDNLLLFIVLFLVITVIILLISYYIKNPFSAPHYEIRIDISGKKKASIPDLIDVYLCENHETIISKCYTARRDYEAACEDRVNHMHLFRSRRAKQYKIRLEQMSADDYPYFVFSFCRDYTKYHQQNYVRTPYVESVETERQYLTILEMQDILSELESIDYATTREKFKAKDQRKLMTKELRQQIKERDHYTCQMCGKVMLDEVGLHIDHIIPIKQGGKSIPENLQVLCSKCNLSKGAR